MFTPVMQPKTRHLYLIIVTNLAFPFWCDTTQDIIHCWYAVSPTGRQHRCLENHLLTRAVFFRDGRFSIPRSVFETVSRAVQCQPQDLATLIQSGEEFVPPPEPQTGAAVETDDDQRKFLKQFYRSKAWAASRETMTFAELVILWNALMNHVMATLIVDEKPVDMGCLTLTPTYMRENWKSILTGMFPKYRRMLKGKNKVDRAVMLHAGGLGDMLRDPILMAWNKGNNTVNMTVEVSLKPIWRRNVARKHGLNKALHGPAFYAKNIAGKLERAVEKHAALYTAYLEAVHRPSVCYADGHVAGSVRLAPYIPDGKIRVAAVEDDFVHPVLDPDFSMSGRERRKGVVTKDEELREMSDISAHSQNVWTCSTG